MGGQAYMIREIQSGRVIEKICFPVAPQTKTRKGRQRGNTLPRKQDANERACTKRLARLLNCNFRAGDLLLSPSYDAEHMEALLENAGEGADVLRRKAEHVVELFLRRLKRELDKAGVELRYIAVTSDMDGDTGELVRVHHHIVIPSDGVTMVSGEIYVGKRRLADIWGQGDMDYRPLHHQDDYTPLAEYLMRQVRRLPDARKYKPSRNLHKPQLISERIVYTSRELRVPKGAKLLCRAAYQPGEAQYIRYVREDQPKRRGGRSHGGGKAESADRGAGADHAV